jgi:hypothetical protein
MKTFPVAGREQIYHRPLRLSALVAGVIVDHFGFSAAFPSAGAAAILALAVFDIRMPEAAEPEAVSLQYSVESVVGPSRQAAFFGPTVANGALRTWVDLQLAPPSRE